MQKLNIAIFGNEDKINYVFGQEKLSEISKLGNLLDTVVTPENISTIDLESIDIIFSTWGMFAPENQYLERLKRLKALFYAAGATNYFDRVFWERGVKVCSAWHANALPVAEYCAANILLGLKNFLQCCFNNNTKEGFAASKQLIGPGVYSKRVTLIGNGAIATKIKELLAPFSVEVSLIATKDVGCRESLIEAFSTSQIVSNHLPDFGDNVKILNEELFSLLPEKGMFLNSGRGRQVDEDGLIKVLKARPDLSALLDVTFPEPPEEDSELYTLDNVFLTPHIAGSANDEVKRMADYMIEDFSRYLNNEPLKYQVPDELFK